MKQRIQEMVLNLKQKMKLDIDVFSDSGEMLASTREKINYVYKNLPLSSYINNTYQDIDQDITYFYIESNMKKYFFVIDRANDISLNYAFMLAQLLKDYIEKISSEMSLNEYVKKLLLSDVSKEDADIYAIKFKMPLDYCFAIVINHEKKQGKELINFLDQYLSGTKDIAIKLSDTSIGYIKFYNNNKEYNSSNEFCEILWESIYEELNYKVNIGIGQEVKTLNELVKSYRQAVNAIRVGEKISEKDHIFSYKKYVFMKIVENAPVSELKQYMDVVINESTKEILDDKEMIRTAEEFFSNSLNISETSRQLFMHRNTLTYRLDKIQKIMGLDIRKFSDAVTFKITLILYRLLQK